MKRKIDCAVWMVTYNHGAFVGKAIESVLAQKTEYRFHLFIGDDCSKDETTSICNSYLTKYSDRITLITHKSNLGATANGIYMYEVCLASGAPYIALLEGDDFWTDNSKLEKQIRFLESNTSVAGCFHDSITIDTNDQKISESYVSRKRRITQKDALMYGGLFPAASLVFRTELIKQFPLELSQFYGGDRLISVVLTGYGDLEYLDYNMSAYRVHRNGMYSGVSTLAKSERQYHDFMLINSITKYRNKYPEIIRKKLAENLSVMTFCYSEENRKLEQLKAALKYLRVMPFKWFDLKRLFSHVLFPGLYRKFRPNSNP